MISEAGFSGEPLGIKAFGSSALPLYQCLW